MAQAVRRRFQAAALVKHIRLRPPANWLIYRKFSVHRVRSHGANHNKHEALRDQRMSAATAPNLQPVSHPAAGRRVLVAEDSPTTHEILKLLLTQRGHHVDIATDGEQALEALRHNHYDVALLDFHLPKMDGLRVATTVRSELPVHARPRLIAITADLPGLLARMRSP